MKISLKTMPALTLRVKQIITSDGEYAVLYRSAAYSMSIKMFAVAAAFAMNLVFSHYLGAASVGQFFLLFSVVSILSMIGKLGMDKTALRFISVYASQNIWGKVKGVQFFSFRIVGLFTLCTSLILFFTAPYIAEYCFKQPELTNSFKWFAVGIAPLAIVQNTSESLKGVGKVQLSQILYDACLPALATLVFVLWPIKTSLSSVYSYLIATFIIFLLTQTVWHTIVNKHKVKRENIDRKEILQSAIPIFWSSVLQQVMQWMPALMLGFWASTKDVGLFQIALRTAQLLVIFQYAFAGNISPKISTLYAEGKIAKIEELCRKSTRLIGFLAFPLLIAFTIFSKFFVGLFGHDFTEGAILLNIMVWGQYYNILMGPVGIALIMCGKEKKLRNSLIISACSLLGLNAIFIPLFGSLGAAITSCIVLVLQNSIAGFYLWKELKIVTLPFLKKGCV